MAQESVIDLGVEEHPQWSYLRLIDWLAGSATLNLGYEEETRGAVGGLELDVGPHTVVGPWLSIASPRSSWLDFVPIASVG